MLPLTAARRTMSCDTTLHGIARPGSMKKAICANSGAAHTPARAQLAWSFASFRCVIDLSPYRQTASLEHEDRREPVWVLGVSGAKDTPQRDLCRIWSQGSADTHPTRGLVRPVHCNRRPVLAQRNLGKGRTDFSLPAHLLDPSEHGVDGRGLDVDEPPHFLDDGEKRIDLKRPPLFKVLEHDVRTDTGHAVDTPLDIPRKCTPTRRPIFRPPPSSARHHAGSR